MTAIVCPGCGARLEVALQVSMVLVDSGVVRATATGSATHECPTEGRQQVTG